MQYYPARVIRVADDSFTVEFADKTRGVIIRNNTHIYYPQTVVEETACRCGKPFINMYELDRYFHEEAIKEFLLHAEDNDSGLAGV